MYNAAGTRTQRRAGTKTTAIPNSAGPKGIYQKFRNGRVGRAGKVRYTTTNESLWRR